MEFGLQHEWKEGRKRKGVLYWSGAVSSRKLLLYEAWTISRDVEISEVPIYICSTIVTIILNIGRRAWSSKATPPSTMRFQTHSQQQMLSSPTLRCPPLPTPNQLDPPLSLQNHSLPGLSPSKEGSVGQYSRPQSSGYNYPWFNNAECHVNPGPPFIIC